VCPAGISTSMVKKAQRHPTRGLTEGAILAALTVLVAAVGLVAPFVGTLLAPLPIMLLVIRWGLRVGALAALVAALIFLQFFGPVNALSVTALFAPLGLGLGWGVWRGLGATLTVLVGACALVIATIASFALATLMLHQDLVGQFVKGLVTSQVEGLKAVLASTLWAVTFAKRNLPPDVLTSLRHNPMLVSQFHQQEEQTRGMIEFTQKFAPTFIYHALPVMLGVGGLIWAYLCYTLARVVLRRVGHEPPGFPPILTWRLPPAFATLMLWIFAGVTFLSPRFPWLATAWVSVLLLTLFVFGFQGTLVALAWMRRRKLSRTFQIIVIALLLSSGLYPILAAVILGLLDGWFDFRKLSAPPPAGDGAADPAAATIPDANDPAQRNDAQTRGDSRGGAGQQPAHQHRHSGSGRRSKTGRRAMRRPREGGASS
jgi:uncharacterized protein YybS (DUF2232 family)